MVDESEFSVYPEQICDSGSLLNMPVVLEGTGMLEGQCHRNTAALWLAGKLDAIGTGYCLSYSDWNNDGKQVLGWCRHSWGIVKGTILETTMTRDKYFGIVIDGDEADEFAEDEFDHEDECLDYATLFPLKRTA